MQALKESLANAQREVDEQRRELERDRSEFERQVQAAHSATSPGAARTADVATSAAEVSEGVSAAEAARTAQLRETLGSFRARLSQLEQSVVSHARLEEERRATLRRALDDAEVLHRNPLVNDTVLTTHALRSWQCPIVSLR